MEMIKVNGFTELSVAEMENVDGGFVIALIAIGTSTYAITSGMVVGAVTTAWAVGTVGYQIYNAFKK